MEGILGVKRPLCSAARTKLKEEREEKRKWHKVNVVERHWEKVNGDGNRRGRKKKGRRRRRNRTYNEKRCKRTDSGRSAECVYGRLFIKQIGK